MVTAELDKCQHNERVIPGIDVLFFVCSHSVKVDWITFPTACAMSGTRDIGRGRKVPGHGIDEGR